MLLIGKYRRGRGTTHLDHVLERARRAAAEVAFHRRIGVAGSLVRVSHLGIVYGFAALVLATAILMVNDDLTEPLLGFEFWRDGFYFVYSLLADLFGLILVLGLASMAVRRLRARPEQDYRRPAGTQGVFDRRLYVVGDWVFLGSMLFIGVTGFVMEGLRIAVTNPDYEVWSVVGWPLSRLFRAAGVVGSDPATDAVRHTLWWGHAIVALIATASIPYTKAMHMLTSPVAIAVTDESAGRRLTAVPESATAEEVGYRSLSDFALIHLLDLDACTRCGQCHVVCPALAAGAPLSPRDLVLDLREAAQGAWGPRSRIGVPPSFDSMVDVIPNVVRPETIWSCTTCLACVEVCPVGIEHVSIISQLRRQLIERGQVDEALQKALENIATTGNSFGAPRRSRSRWAAGTDSTLRDLRSEDAEYLWFVGDYGSLDRRAQDGSRALAALMAVAGLSVGSIQDAERTAGCDVRRIGEESLWRSLAEANIAVMAEVSFDKIVTADPHTFHTLRNEYVELAAWRQMIATRGRPIPVLHHSQLLEELLRSGRLPAIQSLGLDVTYHDPCFLGRYNEVYESPRAVLAAIGVKVHEMPRNRASTFCCGAGGGVIWMKESERSSDVPRPAEQRILEALELPDITVFAVACPKDVVMYSAAVTALGVEDRLMVREIAELVLEATSPQVVGGPGRHRDGATVN
jgi:Fe-S oxidoreductase